MLEGEQKLALLEGDPSRVLAILEPFVLLKAANLAFLGVHFVTLVLLVDRFRFLAVGYGIYLRNG